MFKFGILIICLKYIIFRISYFQQAPIMLWIILGTICTRGFSVIAKNVSSTNVYKEETLRPGSFPSDFNYVTPDNNLLDLNISVDTLPVPAALAAPERSIYDSGYTKTANFIMNTALKLPPHILPTLEELDGSKVSEEATHKSHVGIYLPDKQQNVGLYLPVPKSTRNRIKSEGLKRRRKGNRNTKFRSRQREIAKKQYQKRIEEKLNIQSRISNEVTTESDYKLYYDGELAPVSSRHRKRKNTKTRTKSKIPLIPKNSLAGRLFKFGAQNAKAFTRRRQAQTQSSLRREPNFPPRRRKYSKRPWKPGQKPPYGHTPKMPPLSLLKDYLKLRENVDVQEPSSRTESNSGYMLKQNRIPQRVKSKESYYSYGVHPYSFEPADFRLPWYNYDESVSKSIEETRSNFLDFDNDDEEGGSYNTDYNEVRPGNVAYSAEVNRAPTLNNNKINPNYEDNTYRSKRKPKRQLSTQFPPAKRPEKVQKEKHPKRSRPYTHINMDTSISKYVPKVVKTVLAKSFLKNPRPYLIRLEEDNSKKKKKQRKRKRHRNKFLTRRYTSTTQSYSDLNNNNIDRMDGNQDNSNTPKTDDNISLVNGLLINNQIADPFDLYDDVVSKEYELPSPHKSKFDIGTATTTESNQFFEFEKIKYPRPGYETHKNTHENTIAIVNDKIDQLKVEAGDKEGDVYKEFLNLYEQDRTRANYRPTSISTNYPPIGTHNQFQDEQLPTTQSVPFTQDSKPFINYLQRLSILSGEDYYDDGKTEIDLDSSNDTTICFCCRKHLSNDIDITRNTETNIYRYNRLPLMNKRGREKRAIRIPDPLKSKLIYENIDVLEQSLDCHNQEPIIVKISSRYLDKNHPISRLTFNRNNIDKETKKRNLNHREEKKDIYYVPAKRKSGRYLKPQSRKISLQYPSSISPNINAGQNLEKGKPKPKNKSYYDPKKLSFTFTTPSSIARRYLKYRDKDIVTQNSIFEKESVSSDSIVKPYKHSVSKYDTIESRLINDDYHDIKEVQKNDKSTVLPSSTAMHNSRPQSLPILSNIKKSMHKKVSTFLSESTQSPTHVRANVQPTRKTFHIDPLGLPIFRLIRG